MSGDRTGDRADLRLSKKVKSRGPVEENKKKVSSNQRQQLRSTFAFKEASHTAAERGGGHVGLRMVAPQKIPVLGSDEDVRSFVWRFLSLPHVPRSPL